AGVGSGSGEASGDAATDDASRSRAANSPGVRVGDWNSRTLSLRQADCQLCGTGSVRGVERGSAETGPYQQARQRAAALSDGGSGAGHSAQPAGVAQQVLPLGHASRAEDRQDRYGPQAGGASVLDVAAGPGLRSVQKARFARGRVRKSPW